MTRTVYLNREYLLENEAKISIFDRGFLMADEISVMRGGKHIDTVDASTVSKTDLAEMMIGQNLPTPPKREKNSKQDKALTIKNLTAETENGRSAFKNINFSINQGEVVGIAGVL